MHLDTFIVLLRGINVGGHNKIPMTELRSLCAGLGWEDVQSYIKIGTPVTARNWHTVLKLDEMARHSISGK